MCKYISFGKCNKKYYYILGSISVRFILLFISGFTPNLTPSNTYYIFNFRSSFFSHPLITYCFQYFSMIIGGIILELIYCKINKSRKISETTSSDDTSTINAINFLTEDEIIVNEKNTKEKNFLLKIFFIFTIYFFSKIANSSLNNLGFNRVKFWPLESIFLIIFSKKIMNKMIYKHQILSIIVMVICCTSVYFVNSCIPYDDKDCSLLSDKEKKDCEILIETTYDDIRNKIGLYFIPISIILYILEMIGNAYSTVSTKWLMDIKYINLPRIIIYFGIVGFVCSIIVLFIFSNIPCDITNKFVTYICLFENKGELFYDNYKNLVQIEINKEFYIDVFIIIPLFLISSFLDILFELIIIINLDPLYLIPIDCVFYFICEIIDYCITYSITTYYRDIKFVCQLISNGISIFTCGVYLEIFELHFFDLDKFLRRYIIKRQEQEKKKIMINDANDDLEEASEK